MKSLVPVGLIFLMLVLGCGKFRDSQSRGSTNFDPFGGSLSELLKPEISGDAVKFKLQGTRDTRSEHAGATEAKAFTYLQEGAGVGVQLDGVLVNFPTARQAEAGLRAIASDIGASVVPKNKWQRFSSKDGKTVGWTNGSVMCLVKSDFARPAGNFEEAAPF